MYPGVFCTQCPFSELLPVRPHLTSLSHRDESPVFLEDLSSFMSQATRKELEGSALRAEITKFRACITFLFLALLGELLNC